MRQTAPTNNQPKTAKPRFSTSNYDCELPEDVRAELRGRGRPAPKAGVDTPPTPPPVKPSSPVKAPRDWRGSMPALSGIIALFLVVALIGLGCWFFSDNPAQTAAQPTPAPVPASTPAAVVTTSSSVTVRRADPVPVIVKRAELVRFPELRTGLTDISPVHIDQTHGITMPYGERVNATLRGFLADESQLPKIGRPGDMYLVGSVPWIWTTAPGATAPTWVDP